MSTNLLATRLSASSVIAFTDNVSFPFFAVTAVAFGGDAIMLSKRKTKT
jgi:hypothetical protein